MRKIERIKEFTDELAVLWEKYIPDWRFGQFMSNFFGWLASEKGIDLFFPEEKDMIKYLKEFFGEKDE